MDRKAIYAALAAPFGQDAIERTDGRVTGRGYDTTGIKYQFVVNRLNEVIGLGGWRTHREITVKEISTSSGRKAYEAICDLILELGEWKEGNFLVFAEALADGGHTSTSEADARKGSFTNSLKKAAAMFGCGKSAYEGTLDDDNIPGEGDRPQQPAPSTAPSAPTAPVQPQGSNTANSSRQQRNRLSSKQMGAIWAIARKLDYDQSAFRAQVKSEYGCTLDFLTRDQASDLITRLGVVASNRNSAPNGAAAPAPSGS